MNTAQPTYEELYSELETAIARLEAGDLALEEAVRCYEQGIYLATQCQELLDKAELRVQQLLDGTVAPFEE